MPKYVCDYDSVRSVAEQLISTATKLQSDSQNYYSNMDSSLSGWNGSAKSNFTSQCQIKAQEANANAEEALALGEHIKTTVSKIEQLDSELASLDI